MEVESHTNALLLFYEKVLVEEEDHAEDAEASKDGAGTATGSVAVDVGLLGGDVDPFKEQVRSSNLSLMTRWRTHKEERQCALNT